MAVLVFKVIICVAIVCMAAALVLVIRLLRLARGGKVGRAMRWLLAFVVIFLIGYLAAPLCLWLPAEWSLLLTAVVFLLGAVFVILVLSLVRSLVEQVFAELKL